jgi:hypothetical protein
MKPAPSLLCLALAILCPSASGALAATPPGLLNYQGVLRAADGSPLDGEYDMAFRFMSAEVGGDEILLDEHDAAHANAVTVTDGLFNVGLGGGTVSDGTGPGSYTTLGQVFRDHGAVWLEIEVDGETLSPRVRILSAAYALNADHLDGIDSAALLRSDASDSYTSGTLSMNGSTTLDVNGTLRMDGSVTKATSDRVTNFNADLLDGMDSTAFAGSAHGHAGSDITGAVDEAVNADTVDGKHASEFLDTSATPQTKSGELTADASAITSSIGVEGLGQTAGGYFEDPGASGFAYVGYGNYGIWAHGTSAGGYFRDEGQSGFAYAGRGDRGVEAYGNEMGGYFEDVDDLSFAKVGFGEYGIEAQGDAAGGYFSDRNGSGYGYVGYGDTGVYGRGDFAGGHFRDANASGDAYVGYMDYGILGRGDGMGGFFRDTDSTGEAYIAWGDYGVFGKGEFAGGYFLDTVATGLAYAGYGDYGIYAQGAEAGGRFSDTGGSSSAWLGRGSTGVEGYGNYAGGYFEDPNSSGYATVGYGNYGISAHGSYVGGHFEDTDNSGYAYLAYGNTGIEARGSYRGGYFTDTDSSGYAYVAYGDRGIWAKGTFAGGTFSHPDNTTFWADVSTPTRKIVGTGTVSFVQNHPYEEDRVIAYAAPEGDEVAVYTRGSGRLEAGEARISLGETFRHVANPDVGLTAHVTPRSEGAVVYVESVGTSELVVRAVAGFADDAAFDYLVYGLRIGFEELAVVQAKQRDALPPTAEAIQSDYVEHPELRGFNALERYRKMRLAMGQSGEIDLSGAHELMAALDEQRAAALARAGAEPADPSAELADEGLGSAGASAPPRSEDGSRPIGIAALSSGEGKEGRRAPMDEEGNVYGRSFRPSSTDLASLVDVSEAVEAGDVLVIDTESAGGMRLARSASDPGVFGIVAAEPGVVLGQPRPAEEVDQAEESGGREEAPDAPEGLTAESSSSVPVALSGVVLCKVDAGYGSIRAKDLLTTSPTPGHAMRSDEPIPGTILGKALEPLDSGTGVIRVLVMLR